jgi:hypothetical protein
VDLSQSVELAGILAIEAPTAGRPLVIGPAATRQYWDASHRRSLAWLEALQDARRSGLAASGCGPVLAEVFVTDVLTCLTAALQVHAAKRLGDGSVAAVALKAFERQQRLRHEAMALMVERADAETDAVAAADRLRRRAERWTDVLLGCCPAGLDAEQFAHDPRRADDFRAEPDPFTGAPRRSLRRSLLMTSLRQAFPADLPGVPAHAPLHQAIHAALASMLPNEAPFPPNGPDQPTDGIRFSRLYRRESD